MDQVRLLFDYSPWFILVCLIAGALYAFLLYIRRSSFVNKAWSNKINYILTGLRFVLVTLLCLLLVGPFIRQIKNTIEDPIIVFAVDNSASLAAVEDSVKLQDLKQTLKNAANAVSEDNFEVEFVAFGNKHDLDSVQFDHTTTDLNNLLSDIASDYEGRNLSSVVLFSDGIYNQGISPAYTPFRFLVNTVGLGDTVPKKDINLKNLFYNKITYQGNKFPVVAEILNTGFSGQTVKVDIKRKGIVLGSQQLKLNSDRELNRVEFLLDAKQEGLQHYVLEIEPQEGEFTTQNNSSHAYIEVIEGKEKILLVAESPHPDIKAIKSAIESNQNYELQTYIPALESANQGEKLQTRYDLIIFHQLPGRNSLSILEDFKKKSDSYWYIIGKQTNLPAFNTNNELINVISLNKDLDEVGVVFNQAFDLFRFDNEDQAVVESFIPVIVPFGNLEVKGKTEVILYQKVGNVKTSKPLLLLGGSDKKKAAVMLGEGMWQWRMQEFAKHDNTKAFDALVTKLVQYLSAKEDKRKFRVYPVKEEFEDSQPVVFETELYNDIYEEVYGQPINLTVSSETGEQRKFNYTTNENNTQYRVSNLPEGIYQYTATTSLNNENYTSSGEFTIRSLQIEKLNLTADHNLLRRLSEESGGEFFMPSAIENMVSTITSQKAKGRIYTNEAYLPIINLKWIFFLLLILVTTEWGIRKYLGSY